MQNLIDRISKIEEATARIHAQAEEEKKKIDKEMQAETDAYNARMEAETERKLEQIRGECRALLTDILRSDVVVGEGEEQKDSGK